MSSSRVPTSAFMSFVLAALLTVCTHSVFGQAEDLTDRERSFSDKQLSKQKEISIELKKDEFIVLEVRQNGLDVIVRLRDAKGDTVAISDVPFTEQEAERIVFVAGESGSFKIEIKKKFASRSGSVGFAILDRRAVTERDKILAEAERLYSEAQMLRSSGTTNDRNLSRERFYLSLTKWRDAGDLHGELRTLSVLCYLERLQGSYSTARKLAADILKFPDLPENRIFQIDANYQLAQINFVTGKTDEAIRILENALTNSSGQIPNLAIYLASLGNYYQSIAEIELAEDAFSKAREAVKQLPDIYADAQLRYLLGLYYLTLKDFDLAIENLKVAADMRRLFGNKRGEASALNTLGMCFYHKGDLRSSFGALEKALTMSREVGDTANVASILASLAVNHRESGDPQKAVALLNEAIEMFGERSSPDLNSVHITLGATLIGIGELEKANDSLKLALNGYRSTGDLDGMSRTLHQLARLERERGNLAMSLENIESAIEFHQYVEAKYKNLSEVSRHFEFVRRHYDLYVEILMALYEQTKDTAFAVKAFQISEASRMRTLISQYHEATRGETNNADAEVVRSLIGIQQMIADKLSILARYKYEAKSVTQIEAIERDLSGLFNDRERIRGRSRSAGSLASVLTEPQKLTLKDYQAELSDETVLIEYYLGQQNGFCWILSKDGFQVLTLPKRSSIDSESKAIYSSMAGNAEARNVNGRRTGNARRSTETHGKKLDNQVRSLLDLIRLREVELSGFKRLVIVKDGGLNLIPFSVLVDAIRDTPNGKRSDAIETVTLPSLATLSVLRGSGIRSFEPMSIAAIADPVFSTDDERLGVGRSRRREQNLLGSIGRAKRDFDLTDMVRLPFSRTEAKEIVEQFDGRSEVSLDFRASRDRFLKGEFDDFDIIHFATHGFVNNKHPELSGIVLSLVNEDGVTQNGFLRSHDLFLLKIDPQLVVLSGCQTGLGKQVESEGMMSLARSFMANGTPRVVSSLWKVDDAATAELMKRFYRGIFSERRSPGSALMIAQNELKKIPRYSHPKYWAGFTLTGEWR